MKRFALRTGAVVAALTSVALPAAAAHVTALSKAAADLGYSYSYLGPEDAVALAKAGVTIVIRPGENLFDVNDRTEAMAGPAPRFSLNDVYISDALLRRLRQIGNLYPARQFRDAASVVGASPLLPASASGAIAGLTVSQIPGQQALSVGGKAPARAPVVVTLVGTYTSEVPDVVLSRNEITADRDGTFKTTVSIAPGYFRGSILTVVASSLSGVSPARAQIVMKAPNGNLSTPADEVPRSIR